MTGITITTDETMCVGDDLPAVVRKAGKKKAIAVDGILGTILRQMAEVTVSVCQRHYDAKVTTTHGVVVTERLEPLYDLECYVDVKTGSLYRRDTGACLSSAQLWLADAAPKRASRRKT